MVGSLESTQEKANTMSEPSVKRALVCGASRGIGKATLLALHNQGYQAVPLARSEALLTGIAKDHKLTGGYIVCDVQNKEALRASVQDNAEQHGPFSILINNTGGPPAGPIKEASEDQFLAAFNNHLLTNAALVDMLLPAMQANRFGRIVNVISTSVKAPLAGLGVSNTIRAAVASWAKTLASEVASFGITVNNVLPGATETSRLEEIIRTKAAKKGLSEAEVRESMIAEIPAGRFAKPEETASLISYLCSDMAGYITGTAIPVDGGRTKCL